MSEFNQATQDLPTGTFSADPNCADALQSAALAKAKEVLALEAEAILAMRDRLSSTFDQALDLIEGCQGKVVVTGMGKSGHIARKIAATLASTGTPAFFVHPAELRHGDFGMVDGRDIVIALSGSGETQEIKLILETIKRLGVKMIAFTGNVNSTLAGFSDVVLDVGVVREVCPLNLAPTSSTTAALAMGDAVAIALMEKRNFQIEDYAKLHPGGALGQRTVLVRDIMRAGILVPTVALGDSYNQVLAEIDRKRLGFTAVVNAEKKLIGMITDGDLRRAQVKWGTDAFKKEASEIMSANPKTLSEESLAIEGWKMMEKHSISDILIVDNQSRPVGIVDIKDMLRAGFV